MIRVVVCDPQALVRDAVAAILTSAADVEIIAAVPAFRDAIDAAAKHRPHVVVVTAGEEEAELIAAIRAVRGRSPETAVVVRALEATAEDVYRAASMGARGYLLRDACSEQLLDAVRSAATGGCYLAPALTRQLLDDLVAAYSDTSADRLEGLSKQELEVLRLLAHGHSNAELGRALFLSESTVKTHLSSVFRKLGVRDRVQAVIAAYEARLVRPGAKAA